MRAHAHPETPVRSHLLALLGGFAGLHPAEDFLDSARCVVENFLRLVLLAVLGRDEFFLLGNAPSLSVPLQDIVRAKGQNHEQEQRVVAVASPFGSTRAFLPAPSSPSRVFFAARRSRTAQGHRQLRRVRHL